MDDLVTWLRAQLDDDEQAAIGTGATGHPAWRVVVTDAQSSPTPAQAAHIERHGPWRVMREVEANRRILDRHASYDFPADTEDGPGAYSWTGRCDHCHEPWPCPDLRDVASQYADRPGYREEWRP
ncbi:DUF6221 family protein [Micromonospora sp. SCSIO 07396]